jgi:precorrin-6B methylase 2
MSYVNLTGHRSMALDSIRNAAYARALERMIGRDSVVLDIGAGTGVHGLMAAKVGARRVYLVEPEDVIAVAEENVRANGLQDVVTCLQGRIEDVELPEPVDVIVSALTGNLLVTEDLLPSLFYARDRYLKKGGALVPDQATLTVVPVSAPSLHDEEILAWSAPQAGIDLHAARSYASNTVSYRSQGSEGLSYLAEPTVIHRLDFCESGYEAFRTEIEVPIATTGTCHGWIGWLSIRLGEEWLSASPRDARTHWSWGFLPLDPPLHIEHGEPVRFRLARAPYGDWLWEMTARSGSQRHSTLLSLPMKATTIEKASLQYHPALTEEGRALAHVLARCDGRQGVEEIAESLQALMPQRYRTSAEARRFVQLAVKRHA